MTGAGPHENIRTPLPWSSGRVRGGFTAGIPWQALTPGYSTRNIGEQSGDPDSLLNHYRALIHLRNEHEALRTGAMQLVASTDHGVYSFLRYGAAETILVVANLSDGSDQRLQPVCAG
jgi:alpha-amylase